MKKQIIFTILVLLLAVGVNAQPISESFEGPDFPPTGWQLLDGDYDGNGWMQSDNSPSWKAVDGSHVAYSESVIDGVSLSPNNFLSLARTTIPEGKNLVISFWVGAGDAEHFAEQYSVVVNTSPRFTAGGFAQVLFEDVLESAEFKKVSIPLPESYWGRSMWIAIRHYGGESLLKIDDFRFEEVSREKDIELVAIVQPNSKAGLGSEEQVKIQVCNKGTEPASNFSVSYNINGSNEVTETIAGPLEKDALYEYTFTTTANLATSGTYTINASVDLNGDENPANNTLSKQIINATPDISLRGYSQPVEGIISFNSAFTPDTTILNYFKDEEYWGSEIMAMEYVNGDLYLFSSYMNFGVNYPGNFIRISTNDWSVISKKAVLGESRPNDMTYDYSTNTMYALQSYAEGPVDLCSFDLETGQVTKICSVEELIIGIACNNAGVLYGITTRGSLFTIDKKTGATSLVGDTGLTLPITSQSLAFDHNTGRLFHAIPGTYGEFVEINPQTAIVTHLGQIGGTGYNKVTGLHTIYNPLMPNSYSPVNKAIHQEVDAAVAVKFNKPITAGDLSSITIVGDNGVPATNISASIDGMELIIGHDDLAFDTEYTVTIPVNAINDLLGPVSWSFRTKLDPAGCFIPTEIEVLADARQAHISWRSDGRSDKWEIIYGKTAEMQNATTITVDSNPYVLENLDHNTRYSFYMRGLCSGNEETAWTETITFKTPLDCNAPISIVNTPFTEDFEGEFLPPCWTDYYQLSDERANWSKFDMPNKAYVHTGEASAMHQFGDGNIGGWLITPQIAVPEIEQGSYVLEFWSYIYFPNEYRKNSVLISTGSNNPADGDFTEVWTLPASGAIDDWQQTIIGLTADYAGQDIYVAFRYESESSGHVWYLDDVIFREVDANYDAGIVALKNPVSGGMLSAEEPVVVTIINNGKENITELPVTLKLNNQVIVQETISGINLASMQTYNHTFSEKLNMSAVRSYVVEVSVGLPNDENPKNNVLRTVVKNEGQIVIMGGKTPVSACGVKFVDDGGLTGNYNYAAGEKTMTILPDGGDRVQATFTRFNINEWENDAFPGDTLFIYNGKTVDPQQLIAAWTGNLNDQLPHTLVSTSDDGALTFVFKPLSRYSGIEGWEADITCDDLHTKDVAVSAILLPVRGGNATTNVKIKVTNMGSNPIETAIPVTVNLNGTIVKENIPVGSLPPSKEVEYTFATTINLSTQQVYTLKAYTELVGDMNTTNDTVTRIIDYKYPVTLYGYRVFDGFSSRRDFITFTSNDPEEMTVVNPYKNGDNSISGGEFFDKHLYLRTRDGSTLGNFVKLSTENWTEIFSVPLETLCTDMAYDYSTGTMYAVGSRNLYSIDMETGDATIIKDTGNNLATLACDLSGQLYTITRDGDFYKIDKNTGAMTLINSTGFWPSVVQSMAFDHNTERLFWAMYEEGTEYDDKGLLIEIDPETGETSVRGRISNNAEIVSLYSVYSAPLKHISVTPTDNAVDVDPKTPISVKFNKSFPILDLSKVSISPDPGNVKATASGQYLTISHDDLAINTKYTVTVPSGTIVGYSESIAWSFTTGDGSGIGTVDDSMLSLYPNPVEDFLHVAMDTDQPVHVTIYSVLGKVYLSKEFTDPSFTIDMTGYPSGIMLIKLSTDNKQIVKQIIKK